MDIKNLTQSGGRPAEIVFHAKDETGRETAFTRVFLPPQRLILLGGGHVSQALCGYAADLGFEVAVADDRPAFANAERFPAARRIICDGFENAIRALNVTGYDYVAVLTRGHRHDALCLRELLPGVQPRYLGLIGSRRRTTELFKLLSEEGFDSARIERVYTPIGLPIGAETPKEIAISILAELILVRSKCRAAEETGRLELDSVEEELRDYLLRGEERCALAVVVETKGSTPVPTGAVMAVGALGGIVGTVGGGCGEHEIVLQALDALRTGRPRLAELDMSSDVAEEEGMVCGGRMRVWIEPYAPGEEQ